MILAIIFTALLCPMAFAMGKSRGYWQGWRAGTRSRDDEARALTEHIRLLEAEIEKHERKLYAERKRLHNS